ncbi:MAG: Gfo/Idh/MocA family oxidoreductase [Ruminococcaceae bacterium]|nr:Gfo/Idh/MocA family oxidoreductase [Oscillospiraceae bacterium]
MIRVGIIGVGNIGFAHATAIYENKIPLLKLSALCDIDPKRIEKLRQLYPTVHMYADADTMLQSETLDAIIIATPHYDHPTLALRAFSCGLHVLSEKPIGVYCENARKAVEASKKSGKIYAMMFNQRTNKLFRLAKDLIEAGELGELKRSVWIVTNWYRTQEYYDSGNWRATWAGEGGGVLMNQAPHNLDLWQWLCGMPTEISAQCNTGRFHPIEVEDEATILARYENGASGVFITSTGDLPGTNRLEITGTKGTLLLEHKTLTLHRLSKDEREYCFSSDSSAPSVETTVWEDEPYQGHHRVLENFGRAILYGDPLVASGEEALKELTLSNAAYLSAWQGRPISLPLDDAEYFAELQKRIHTSQPKHVSASVHESEAMYNKRWDTNW